MRVAGTSDSTVLAARAGDARALDALVAASLPLVYNIVGRALDGHPDVDDVVQETLLRVVRSLGELRQPGAFRSWLVAIAIRQVRDRERERRTVHFHQAELDAAEEIADPASDFATLTVLRLGLTDQRREVAEATRWLDKDDRSLLSLWWLEETGELTRSELAEALGLSARHAAVRVQRMKEQLETARTIVRALQSTPGCGDLQDLARPWDGVPSPLWRKRLARHIRDCETCAESTGTLYPVGRLLGGMPLLPVPPSLVHLVVGAGTAGALGTANALGHAGTAGTAGTAGAGGGVGTGGSAGTGGTAGTTGTAGGSSGAAGGGGHGRGRGAHRSTSRAKSLLHAKLLPVSAAAGAVAAVAVGALLVSGLGSGPSKPTAAEKPLASVSAAAAPSLTTPSASASSSPSSTPSHSATPSRTPSHSATPKAPAKAPAAPVVPVSSSKKGASVWSFSGVDSALADSGASWYYTWSTTHPGITAPSKVGFVPMIWGAKSVTASTLAQAKSEGPYLLGFNEPDMAAQSNMTVAQALQLWPQLEATGSILGSPAVAYGGDTPGGWLDQFMSGAKAKGYRVDFITLHWYGSDFNTTDAVNQLRSYIQAVYNRYHLPIWLTEYALINFSNGTSYPTDAQQAAFVTASTTMLSSLSYLQRYAWFALPASDTGASTGLFHSGPVATAAGRAYEAAGG